MKGSTAPHQVNEEAPSMQGFIQLVVAQYSTFETAIEVFRSGCGRDWGEHHGCCFCGTDRFSAPAITPIW